MEFVDTSLQWLKDMAGSFGLPFDPNPLNSPYVQGQIPQPAGTPAPAPTPGVTIIPGINVAVKDSTLYMIAAALAAYLILSKKRR